MVRALIAEDSATIQQLLVEILSADIEVEIIGLAKNGNEAVEMTKRLRPDVIVMDVNMPVMDGFEATKQIMIEVPTPIVIVSASLNVREVNVSMAALRAGALALLEKPRGISSPKFEELVRQLLWTIKAMAGVKVVRHRRELAVPLRTLPLMDAFQPKEVGLIAIAASTGGPAALARILSELPAQFPAPILVVQHISRGFVAGLAASLNITCSLRVKVATDGELLEPSTVYLAGDDFHMGISRGARIELDNSQPVGGFRPSATYLFESVTGEFGSSTVAVVLTGMGRDGVEGLRAVRSAGGLVIAQDEASSVVFGMPGAAIAAGLVDRILPLSAIGECLSQLVGTPELAANKEQ